MQPSCPAEGAVAAEAVHRAEEARDEADGAVITKGIAVVSEGKAARSRCSRSEVQSGGGEGRSRRSD